MDDVSHWMRPLGLFLDLAALGRHEYGHAMATSPSAPSKRASLGLLSMLALGINTIVGSGIFRFPAELAADMGPASVLSFGACAILLSVVALCFAEAGGMFEREGGAYAYAEAAFGPRLGFAVGWASWLATVLTLAAVAVALPGQLAELAPALGTPTGGKLGAILVIVALGALNVCGRKPSSWTGNALVAIKLAALLAFVVLGARHVDAANLRPFAPKGYAPLGPALLFTFFALSGFESSAVPAGEARRARRDVPIAVTVSLLGAALLYTAIQLVAVGVQPGLAQSERPLADAARSFLGEGGARAMSVAGALSMLGLCTAMAFNAPRFMVALADDGHLPEAFARWHPRWDTPHVATYVGTALAVVFAALLDFRTLVDFTSVVLIAQYLSTCIAVPVLRRRQPDRPRSWRVPFGPVLPVLGVIMMLAVLSQSKWQELALAAGVMALGFVVRALRVRGGDGP
jgi:amino acid transporter